MRFSFLFTEAVRGLRRNLAMSFAVTVTVAVSLALLGAALLLRSEAQMMRGYWYGKVEVSVFLCRQKEPVGCERAVTAAQKTAIRSRITALPGVRSVYFEDRDEAYRHFSDQFADTPELVDSVTPAALPEAFRVQLADPDVTDAVITAIAEHPGVDEVADHRKLLGPFLRVVSALQTVALGVAAVLLSVAVVLIANTVRLSALARRRELSIMRLVGASKKGLMVPFLLEGAVSALAGTALAVGVLAAAQHWGVDARLRPGMPGIPLIGFGQLWALTPELAGGALVTVLTASAVLLRRHLRR